MKYKNILCVTISILLSIGLGSCKKDTKKLEAEKIVAEWMGKKIILPVNIPCTYLGRDTTCLNGNTPYKVLIYTDSTGCTDCKLQLYKWITLIEEVDSLMLGHVSFHFYFQPKDEKELIFLFRRDHFTQTVYMDRDNKLYEVNRFPKNMSYQCFLLNKDNKVLLIGNPILSPKILELYKEAVMGTNNMEKKKNINTTVEIEQTEIVLPNTTIHETSIATFIIKNTGDVPLLIKDISASCGCTVPEWKRKPIKPGERTVIKVKVTPDTLGYFRKMITVFCNTKEGVVTLSVKSTVNG